MTNKSKAAAGLCEWAVHIVQYYDVWSTVEPKRQELAAGARGAGVQAGKAGHSGLLLSAVHAVRPRT